MKNLLIVLGILLIGIGGLRVYTQSMAVDNGSDQVQQLDSTQNGDEVDPEVEAQFATIPTKVATDVITEGEAAYYYFFQPSCPHCIAIKPDIVDYYTNKSDEVRFYTVDLTLDENKDVWNEELTAVGDEVETVADFKVTGTPVLVKTDGTKVSNVAIGDSGVVGLLEAE